MLITKRYRPQNNKILTIAMQKKEKTTLKEMLYKYSVFRTFVFPIYIRIHIIYKSAPVPFALSSIIRTLLDFSPWNP